MVKKTEIARECKKCGVVFSGTRCKACSRANAAKWREQNPEKAREHLKAWATTPEKRAATALTYRENNRELLAAKTAAYRERNAEKCREAVRRWRAENPEKSQQLATLYRAIDPEKNRRAVRTWAKMYPARRNAIQQNRRARKIEAGGKLSIGLGERLLVLQKGRCACCGESLDAGYNLDHIVPLARGGVNEDWNIQLLTPKCNSAKAAKDPVEYMQHKGFLI